MMDMAVTSNNTISGTTKLTISVVLATHNGEKFIAQQFQSLLAQSYKPSEIIVSDDASIDNTLKIINDLTKSSDIPVNIRVNKTALGYADNFLLAATYANGDLIAFCDQDDMWHEKKLERIQQVFTSQDIVLAVHSAKQIDDQNNIIGDFDNRISSTAIKYPLSYSPWHVFFGFTMTFRRDLLNIIPSSLRPMDTVHRDRAMAHDRWILFLANLMGKTAEISEPLASYRQHRNNLFGAKPTRIAASKLAVRNDSQKYLETAIKLRDNIDQIPSTSKEKFPLFDDQKCKQFWDRVIVQQEARAEVYNSESIVRSGFQILRNILTFKYNNVNDNRFQPRSLGKDIYFLFQRSSD